MWITSGCLSSTRGLVPLNKGVGFLILMTLTFVCFPFSFSSLEAKTAVKERETKKRSLLKRGAVPPWVPLCHVGQGGEVVLLLISQPWAAPWRARSLTER